MPSIQEVYDEVNKTEITFIMLSLDQDRFLAKVKTYVSEKSFSFPVYMLSGRVPDQLRVGVIPTTFVIAKDGTIATQQTGMKNYNTAKFKKYLERLSQE
jgi:hypothetical protein